MTDRPANVPSDWVLTDCANPNCDYTVWVPYDVEDVPGSNVLAVCSTACATEIMQGASIGLIVP